MNNSNNSIMPPIDASNNYINLLLPEDLLHNEFYPLNLTGPLCPLLNNNDLLYDFYDKSGHKADIIKFYKDHSWDAKAKYQAPFTGPELKRVLPSLLNSVQGRVLLNLEHNLKLHNTIWNWFLKLNEPLSNNIMKYCYVDPDGRYFLKPEGLTNFLDSIIEPVDQDTRNQIAYAILAFAMLEPDSRTGLISVFLKKFPDYSPLLGISETPIPLSIIVNPKIPAGVNDSIVSENSTLAETPPGVSSECSSDININGKIPLSTNSQKGNESLSISANAPDRPASCYYINIIADINKHRALQLNAKKFSEQASAIASLDNLCDFSDSGIVRSQLSSLDSLCIQISSLSNDIQRTFSTSCLNNNSKCPLSKFVNGNNLSTVSKLRHLIDDFEKIMYHALQLNKTIELKKIQFKNSVENCTRLSRNLGIKDADKIILPEETTPCILLDLFEKQDKMEENLVQRKKDKLAEEKQGIIERLEKLRKSYNLTSDSQFKKQLVCYHKILEKIHAAIDFNDIPEIYKNIEDLEFECLEIESNDYRKLARYCLDNTDDISRFLDLCDSLLFASKPDIACILLHTGQKRFSPVENIMFCERFIKTLMDVCCKLSSSGADPSHIWKDILQSTWMLSVKHGDIKDPEMLEQLTMFLTAAAFDNNEMAAVFLANIRSIDICNQYMHNQLILQIIRSVIEHRKYKIISKVEKETLELLAGDINECLSKDGGKYRHIQTKENGDFIEFEIYFVFPELERIWNKIYSDVENRKYDKALQEINEVNAEELYEELKRAYNDRHFKDHSMFTGKIKKYIIEFTNKIEVYVRKSKELLDTEDFIIIKEELIANLKEWLEENEKRSGVYDIFLKQISTLCNPASNKSDLIDSISRDKNVIWGCPNFIVWLCEKTAPVAMQDAYEIILKDLTEDFSYQEAAGILEDGEAWLHCDILASLSPDASPLEGSWTAKSNAAIENINTKITIELKEKINSLIIDGHFRAAQAIAEECKHKKDSLKAEEQKDISAFVTDKLDSICKLKNQTETINMPAEWIDKVLECANRIDTQLRHLKRAEQAEEGKKRLNKAISTLEFIVRERSRTFSSLETLLTLPDDNTNSGSMFVDQINLAIEKSPEIFKYWDKLSQETRCGKDELDRAWLGFAKAFALKCNLYRDENRTLTTIPSIKYPFSIYKTAFYKPKSVFLSKDIQLYLYRQNNIDTHDFRLLEDELPDISRLHIIFAPQGYERISRLLKHESDCFKNFLLLNKEFLARVILAEKSDVPLRQYLHSSVTDLASSSPFVSQGYCHQNNNIYVGRTEILQKLLNYQQSTIWGGRRLGKTSVLHALENTLERTHAVAYVYADIPEDGDPDLSLGKKIAEKLNLGEINSISDLERILSALISSGRKIAILLDEVDEYIKKSRTKHADAFPLATTLRQLIMSDPDKQTILVYSGYHQLYFEAELDQSKKRVGHPFKNVTQHIDIGILTVDEVEELVRIGFEEMLNISIDPAVPSLIYSKASGHPAFVQRFCQCLLERVSRRRSTSKKVIITEEDVEAVYRASAKQDGCEPFIFYFNDTLDLNLSHLGRAIMLVICDLYKTSADSNSQELYFSMQAIQNHLKEWSDDVADVEMPVISDIRQTIELLKMTNMLTQNPNDVNLYKISYPAYIEILHRLDKLGRQEIVASLEKYDKEERNKGVLL